MFLLYHYYRVGGPPNLNPTNPSKSWLTQAVSCSAFGDSAGVLRGELKRPC